MAEEQFHLLTRFHFPRTPSAVTVGPGLPTTFGGEVETRTCSCMDRQGPSGVSEDSTEEL